jgi:hypothetical protein
MTNRVLAIAALFSASLFFAHPIDAQTTAAAPDPLKDPAANALQNYFVAQKVGDQAVLKKTIEVTNPQKNEYADAVLSFQLWSRYFERKAVDKFGKEAGMGIQGHARTYDDQYAVDMKRIRDANVQYSVDRNSATVYLRVELNRPENLQVDRFEFLDVYQMIKAADGWKVDFLKTYKCLDPEQEEVYQSEAAAFPRMARVCSELSEQLKKDQIRNADDLKNIFEEKWSHVYDAPIRHVLKPGETLPADALPAK